MCADFNYYLNRAGVRGLQGVKGDQGDSPIITVQTETPNEYILKITNPDGTELISPNLRGNKININEGTYVRCNTATGELYTSTADGATGELAGVVRLATDVDITDMDERTVVTPSQLADALSQYLVSPNGSIKIVQNADTSLTELTVQGGLTDVPIASADTLGVVKIGENLSITEDGVLSSTAGGGDVSGSGDNTFTGTNDFNGAVNLNGITIAENLTVTRNFTSSGEINAVSIKSTGIRSDDIKTTTNKKYLTEEDVDNQTIQIVDDRLHANFDEVNGKISDVSSRVTSLENQVGDISTTVDSNTTDIENLKKTKNDNIFDIGKFTVVGNPTITDDGVASGFSTNNYLTVPNKILQKIGQKPFEIRVKFSNIPMFAGTIRFPSVLGNMTSAVENRTNITLSRNNRNPFLFLEANFTDGTHSSIGYTTNIPETLAGVEYSLIFDGSTYTVKALANGVQLPFVRGSVSGKFIDWGTEDLFIGVRSVGASFDLKQFSITVDGKEVFNGLMSSTKPIYDKIKANDTELSEFKVETSNDFSAVNSALNEKANLSDVALKQNTLIEGDNITLTNNADGTTTISASGTISPTIELVDGGNASGT